MDCILIISQENPELAIGEIEELCKTTVTRLRDDAVRVFIDEPLLCSRLAFTRSVSEIVAVAPESELAAAVSSSYKLLGKLSGSYRITIHGHGKTKLRECDFAAMFSVHLPLMRVDVKNPGIIFDIIPADVIYLGRRIHTNNEDWENRKAHHRIVLHPSGMHPKLARGLVNLSGARKELLDPLCGVGGILIEACLMGLHAVGSDIDAKLLDGARKNLRALGLHDFTLHERDVLTLDQLRIKTATIVTDFPYGRHSHAPKDLVGFYLQALIEFAKLTRKAIVMMPNNIDANAIIAKTPWNIKRSFSWYTHKSLTRMIYVLELS